MQTTGYFLPANTYSDWARNECEDFVPNERQKLVMDVVRQAIDAGMYYTKDVLAFAKERLKPSEAELERGKGVEGGEFGMDVYYARQAITSAKKFAVSREAWQHLRPTPGKSLGTIMFNDYKRITGSTIIGFAGEGDISTGKGMRMVIEGKRGSVKVRLEATASQVRSAIDRAHEKGLRKITFEEINSPAPTAPKAKKTAPADSASEPCLF